MADTTPHLALPYLVASQADKHVTFNEALDRLDALAQISVVSATLVAEPATPAEGACYILPAGKTGNTWANFGAGQIARFQTGGWVSITARIGWLAYVEDMAQVLMYSLTGWSQSSIRTSLGLGDAAARSTGTSGAKIPLLDGANVWAANQVFQGSVSLENAQPNFVLKDSDAPANEKLWRLIASGPSLSLQALNDAQAATTILQADRTGGTLTSVSFPFDGAFGFGTNNPQSHGADIVLARTKPGSQTIIKAVNASNAASSQARIDLATGVPNGYAVFGLTNVSTTSADFVFSSGSGVAGMALYFNRYSFLSPSGSELARLEGGVFRPGTDNATALGSATQRWSSIYAATGTINTSDAREKTVLQPIPAGVKRAVANIRQKIGVFQWQSALAAKGEHKARFHIGVTAQMVRDAFIAEGEDPHRWALFCEDELSQAIETVPAIYDKSGAIIAPAQVAHTPVLDDAGNVQTRLGLRSDQLMWLMLATG
jgi:hypothetical protein